jgi:hypothetical protein
MLRRVNRFLRRHYESRLPKKSTHVIVDLTTGRMVVEPPASPAERPDLWPEAWWMRFGALGR